MKSRLRAVLLIVLGAILAGIAAAVYFVTVGVSARPLPSSPETAVAHGVRDLAISLRTRALKNPVPVSPEVIREGRDHFADHCAVCHANNGSGDTEMGRGLYPRPPDMRQAATQNLSDAELFYIIENGVRLTGMSAWSTGTKDGEVASWHLVHFIRTLPRLSDDDIEEMKKLNPRSPEEVRQEIEEENFLRGSAAAPPLPSTTTHKHKGAEQ